MAKREFVQLAHTLKNQRIGGWFASEKLDGMRCFWDGGITRGVLKSNVPWANTDKDDRYNEPPVATGLWSRYGNVIHAPDVWLDMLPRLLLDGELYIPDYRQKLMSIVKKLKPTQDWDDVKYYVFDIVPTETVFSDGVIKCTNFNKVITGALSWFNHDELDFNLVNTKQYQDVVKLMSMKISENIILRVHEQKRLSFRSNEASEQATILCDEITEKGGEGLILRSDLASYECKRSHNLLKMKPTDDMEGVVTGYITGRKTELGSKLLGLMGALILELDNGIRLELSGFTDAERCLGDGFQWAVDNPETECPVNISATQFPRGSRITFKYRGLTRDGVPQEARYWRKDIRI